MPISNNHWNPNNRGFKERMTTKQWKDILLKEEDKVIVRGVLRQVKAKNLGYGVVEVWVSGLEDKTP